MEKRIVDDGAEVLVGELLLAEDNLVYRTWQAGKNAAERARHDAKDSAS